MFEIQSAYILAAVDLIVPMLLIVMGEERWLLAWICFASGLNLFDTLVVINVPAARIAGVLLIPQTLINLSWISRSKTARAIIAQYLLLVVTGILFGLIFPWPDDGLARSFNQLPAGRTIIFLGRSLADISLTFFVAKQLIKSDVSKNILNYFLIGTSLAALAGIFEFATRVDIYQLITAVGYNNDGFRVRGLCMEPRALGFVTLYGLLFSIILFTRKRSRANFLLMVVNATGFLISGSTSAYVAFVFGAFALGLYLKRARTILIALTVVGLCVIGCIAFYEAGSVGHISQSIEERLSGKRFEEPQNLLESIAFRMEIFDGPPLLFFADNLIYLLTGTGPGLIPLPATPYMTSSDAYSWLKDTGINSPPTMGLLLELSNTGVLGLLLFFYICFSSLQSFSFLALHDSDKSEEWLEIRAAFVIGVAIYMVQNSSLSAIWPILLGMGVGANYLVQAGQYRFQSRSTALAPRSQVTGNCSRVS